MVGGNLTNLSYHKILSLFIHPEEGDVSAVCSFSLCALRVYFFAMHPATVEIQESSITFPYYT